MIRYVDILLLQLEEEEEKEKEEERLIIIAARTDGIGMVGMMIQQ